ncbi:hypothetical protein DFH07DRAFT_771508 [Mycena maculata]|uniref:GPI anchored cell wall protein n=1 Tax=Mycena maculata TaxID=230809 RepID=A0AAD7JCT7_9AGAR|nr:hypothetical protein DFH07DRAFT_771508 [Mycena maculata]
MKAITSCLLFASLLVKARPSPDPPVTLLAAQIDSDCADDACPIASISVLGIAGDVTTYGLLGEAASIETLIEGPAGYTLSHTDLVDGTTLSIEDDCTFVSGGSSAVNCVQHFGFDVATVTSAKVQAIATLTASGGGTAASGSESGSGPAPAKTGSNGGVRTGNVTGIGCALIMVTATVVTLSGISMW